MLIHGAVAATALSIVIYYIVQNHGSGPVRAVILFVLAALGGLTLFTIDISKKKPIPKLIAIIHPLVGVSGLIALIYYVLSK